MHPHEAVRTDHDARFLERFAARGVGRLFTGVDDPGDRGERPVVAAVAEQDLVSPDDDGRHADERQGHGPDVAAELDDEVGDRHPAS